MLKTAFKFMKYDKPKSIGIIVGIVISIFLIGQQMATLFFLTDLMGGLEIHSNSKDDDIWMIDESGKNINSLNFIDARFVQQVRSLNGVKNSFPVVITQAPVVFKDGKNSSVMLIGSDGPEFVAGPKESIVDQGNVLDLQASGNISVEYFNIKSWKTDLNLNDQLEINNKNATVKTITKNAQGYGGHFVYTSLNNARFYGNTPPNLVSVIVVRPEENADVQKLIDEINRTFLGIKAWRAADIKDITINEILVESNTGMSFGSLVVFAIISGFFIIGITMYSSVLDRLTDYGTLKAIGANNKYVTNLILMQALLFAIIGFSIAFLMLILFQQGMAGMGMILKFPLLFVLGLLGVTLFMSIGGSMFAIIKIRKLEPASVF